MLIKKYVVDSMNEALTKIRNDLGKDAVIISQRKIKKPGFKGLFSSKQIEVTAACENSQADVVKKSNRNSNLQYKQDNNMQESIRNIKQMLMQKELLENKSDTTFKVQPKAVTEENPSKVNKLENEIESMKGLLNEVVKNTAKEEDKLLSVLKDLDIDLEFYDEIKDSISEDNLELSLRDIVKDSIEISKDDLRGNVVLVGPTGVGKTTTIAKLAGRLSLIEKKKVGLITIDTYRIGAVEQLKTYAEIMNIPFKVVITTKEMKEAVESMKDCDVVLIDTTGRSSKNTMQLSELRAFIEKADPDCVCAVISATTKNKDIKTILEGYGNLNYDKVIITKLDETTTYGSLYNIEKRAGKPLKFITIGQNVPDDIKEPTKDEIVKFIFGEETLC